jgi:hypothetical protein
MTVRGRRGDHPFAALRGFFFQLYHYPGLFIRSDYTMSSAAFLDQYEPLDIIGNGSFGIIRKVRRKTDGLVRLAKCQKLLLRHSLLLSIDFCTKGTKF